MKKLDFVNRTTLKVENIEGFMVRKVTRFGTGAKVDCLEIQQVVRECNSSYKNPSVF